MSKWLTYNPTSGHGHRLITVSASTISELEERVANITATNSYYNLSATTTVIQDDTVTGYTAEYLTVEIQSAGTIGVKCLITYEYLSYSKDSGNTWNQLIASTGETAYITAQVGDVIWFKRSSVGQIITFFGTAKFEVYGNIMSLFYGDNFAKKKEFPSSIPATNMFRNCTGLTSAENLVLPATTLANSCYAGMFSGCTSLTKAPELTATTLANSCYASMFKGCSSLTTAPELPATTLANSCYEYMFQSCTNLLTAPALPAITLTTNCYNCMFYGCTSLTTAPELPATTLADYCYWAMFYDCTGLTSAPELPSTDLAEGCYSAMFQNCSSLTTAPELKAKILAVSCYENMFTNCASLNYIKCLATNILAENCTIEWVANVSSSGTFVKDTSMSSWTTGRDGIPSGWTVQNA